MVAVTWEYRSRVMAIWLWPNISLTILGGCRGQAAAWAIGQELGDEQLTAIPSTMIGLALAVQGQWAKAGRLLSQAVPALERSGEWREWCREVGYVGISVVARGDYHRGAAEAQRALDRALELSDQAIIGSNHILLCVTHVLNERMKALAATARRRSRRPSGQASRSSSTPVSPSAVGPTEGSTTIRPPAATWNSSMPSVQVWAGSSSPIGSPSPAPTSPWPWDASTKP
jgi:hypothetical protein